MKLRDEPCAEKGLWNEITWIFISWLHHITCVALGRSHQHFRVLYLNSYWCHQGLLIFTDYDSVPVFPWPTKLLMDYCTLRILCYAFVWVVSSALEFSPHFRGLGRLTFLLEPIHFISCQKIPLIVLGMVNCTNSHCIQGLLKYLTLPQMSNYMSIFTLKQSLFSMAKTKSY